MIAAASLPAFAGPVAERPAEILVLLALLSLVPVALVMLTSFLKIALVLSIARSALGAPQVPPSSAVTGLALALTVVVMAPTAERSLALARPALSERGVAATAAALAKAAEPLRAFLGRFAPAD